MEITLTPKSYEVINAVMEKTAIFTIDSLPTNTAYKDSGVLSEKQDLRLRAKWLYDKYGMYNSAIDYSTFPKRIFEYFHYSDFINSLRQRLNIIHEMMDCDFDTNTPVHISIAKSDVIDRPNLNVLDLHDQYKMLDFSVVAHPGQTRLQASVFLQRPLHRVLLYINKETLKDVKLETKGLREITSIEELIPHYRYRRNRTDIGNPDQVELDFYLPNLVDEHDLPAKYHRVNKTYILKMSSATVKKRDNKDAAHPSDYYLTDSFLTTDKYFRILNNNTLNIYSNNIKQISKAQFHTQNLLRSTFTNSPNGDLSVYDYLSGYREFGEFFNQNYDLSQTFYLEQLLDEIGNNEAFSGTDQKIISDIDYIIRKYGNKKFGWEYNLIESNPSDPVDYVTLNDFKGYCIVINTGDCKRTYEELFMVAHPNYSIIRSKQSKVMVINCEHEYWKTGKNYKEYILTDNFFDNENRIQNTI